MIAPTAGVWPVRHPKAWAWANHWFALPRHGTGFRLYTYQVQKPKAKRLPMAGVQFDEIGRDGVAIRRATGFTKSGPVPPGTTTMPPAVSSALASARM